MRFRANKVAAKLAMVGLSSVGGLLLATATMPVGPLVPDGEAAAAAPAAPTPFWSPAALSDLQAEALAAEQEGLDASAYGLEEIAALAARGPSGALDDAATQAAVALARDYAVGRVPDSRRTGWHIPRDDLDRERLILQLEAAIRSNRLRPWLRGLLPGDPRYAALRDAYAATPPAERSRRDRLRVNLERWRWLPREIGADHLFVNVPAYRLDLYEDGERVASHDVIVGKPSTPTPQIAVPAVSLVVNPWWTPPPSIARGLGAGGSYVYSGGRLRQRPGPGNALGRVKLDMPNPHIVYLHDTPAKGLFGARSRAFSHGCVRVRDMAALAARLAELDRGSSGDVRRALARSATRTLAFEKLRPVYFVYFTAEAEPGGAVTLHDDPYGRDRRVLASLDAQAA
ncbi:MAG TPA: L,D-transpeptidase family protein [Allosphingosinicella sp.]|nr:L,D-transpeptidase family protein [Allosphingosinicella sp.]